MNCQTVFMMIIIAPITAFGCYKCGAYAVDRAKWLKDQVHFSDIRSPRWGFKEPIFPMIPIALAVAAIIVSTYEINTGELIANDCQKRKLEKETKVSKGDKIGNNRNSCRWS